MDFPPLSEKHRAHLAENYGLDQAKLGRLLEEIWSLTAMTSQAYAIKRHAELKARGERNEAIYLSILSELESGRFQTEELSERQVRRMIYG